MSAFQEIYDLLVADSSIESYVSTRIYNEYLPNNADLTLDHIVYEGRIAQAEHTIDVKHWGDQYNFAIKVISSNHVTDSSISGEVIRTMHAYTSTNIPDIIFERDNQVFDPDNEIHTTSMDFTVWYYNNPS